VDVAALNRITLVVLNDRVCAVIAVPCGGGNTTRRRIDELDSPTEDSLVSCLVAFTIWGYRHLGRNSWGWRLIYYRT
jgi:hypothetical protein